MGRDVSLLLFKVFVEEFSLVSWKKASLDD